MAYVFYVAVKLISYIAWCWVGLKMWRPSRTSLPAAAAFGVLRLGIGILFGVVIFFAASTGAENLLTKYIAIYAPVRMLEWLIMGFLIRRTAERRTAFGLLMWCAGGIVVSFAADFASPEGVAGHFCVGRCLC